MNAVRFPEGNWIVHPTMRLPLPESETMSLVQRGVIWISQRKAKSDTPLNVFVALSRLGNIFLPYSLFMSQLLMRGRMDRIDKELIVLHTAWRLGCVYEWVHHSHMAVELGVSDALVQSMGQNSSPMWSKRITTLLTAADELLDHRMLNNVMLDRLREELSDDQIVEFCFLVGHYQMVAMTINTLGVAPEADFLGDTKLPASRAA